MLEDAWSAPGEDEGPSGFPWVAARSFLEGGSFEEEDILVEFRLNLDNDKF